MLKGRFSPYLKMNKKVRKSKGPRTKKSKHTNKLQILAGYLLKGIKPRK